MHRLNQTQDVIVYKLTVKDTVEERILDLQEKKRQLADATIEGKTAAANLTMEDMLKLFRHDAEHTGHAVDETGIGIGLELAKGKGGRVLVENTGGAAAGGGRRGERVDGARASGMQNSKTGPEHAVYGRRW